MKIYVAVQERDSDVLVLSLTTRNPSLKVTFNKDVVDTNLDPNDFSVMVIEPYLLEESSQSKCCTALNEWLGDQPKCKIIFRTVLDLTYFDEVKFPFTYLGKHTQLFDTRVLIEQAIDSIFEEALTGLPDVYGVNIQNFGKRKTSIRSYTNVNTTWVNSIESLKTIDKDMKIQIKYMNRNGKFWVIFFDKFSFENLKDNTPYWFNLTRAIGFISFKTKILLVCGDNGELVTKQVLPAIERQVEQSSIPWPVIHSEENALGIHLVTSEEEAIQYLTRKFPAYVRFEDI